MHKSFELVREIGKITVRLDNGTTATFRMRTELAMPKVRTVDKLSRELERSIASLGFWAAKATEANRVVRRAERKMKHRRAKIAMGWRNHINKSPDYVTTEYRLVEDCVEADERTEKLAARVDAAKYQAELLTAVRDCVRQKVYALERMLASHGSGR